MILYDDGDTVVIVLYFHSCTSDVTLFFTLLEA